MTDDDLDLIELAPTLLAKQLLRFVFEYRDALVAKAATGIGPDSDEWKPLLAMLPAAQQALDQLIAGADDDGGDGKKVRH